MQDRHFEEGPGLGNLSGGYAIKLSNYHRFILKMILAAIAMLEKQIEALNYEILCVMKDNETLLDRMKKALGISDVSACDIMAEIGPTLDSFPTDTALVSWSGLCPGNNESAGKRKSGRSPVRKHHLKTIMVEVVWVAVKKKGHLLQGQVLPSQGMPGCKKSHCGDCPPDAFGGLSCHQG